MFSKLISAIFLAFIMVFYTYSLALLNFNSYTYGDQYFEVKEGWDGNKDQSFHRWFP